MQLPFARPAASLRLVAAIVIATAGSPACDDSQPVARHELAIDENIARLDDLNPSYVGHIERAIERQMTGPVQVRWEGGVRRDDPPLAACPPEAPTECGNSHCCPANMFCASGCSDGERYCASRGSGAAREPCDAIAGGPCAEGLVCRTVTKHIGDSGPAICTRECGAPEDCADMSTGFCCVVGGCQYLAEDCRPEFVTDVYGEPAGGAE